MVHCSNSSEPQNKTERDVVALVGNPNVGKSVLFSLFTGRYVVVSNYPGTTVEVSEGSARIGGRDTEVIDTPGVNGLIPRSEDEEVARAILIEREPKAVIQVADGKNLRRSLQITTQLAEMGLPVTMALNMWDEAMDRGVEVDAVALSQLVGVPVVKTVAVQRHGITALLSSVGEAAAPTLQVDYGREIEAAVADLAAKLPPLVPDTRALALMLLSGDADLERRLALLAAPESGIDIEDAAATGGEPATFDNPWQAEIAAAQERLQRHFNEPLSYVISRKRAARVDEIVDQVMTTRLTAKPHTLLQKMFFVAIGPLMALGVGALTAWLLLAGLNAFVELGGAFTPLMLVITALIAAAYCKVLWRWRHSGNAAVVTGNIAMHPLLGFPILLVVLALLYKFVGEFGAGAVVDFIEEQIFGEDPIELLGMVIPFAGITHYLASFTELFIPAGGLIYEILFAEDAGLISVGLTYSIAIVLPIVGFFFFAFGLLEDSGYLPRLAVMVDWLMKRVGLNGKAVLPMVLGLGCGTMATLTTRILETRKQRVLATLLLALAVPCSAQVGIIAAVLASIGGGGAFALYFFVILAQFFIVGIIASKVLGGENSDFMLEVPPFRIPKIRNVALKTLYRMKWFMKEAVPLFILGTLALFILTRVGYNEETRPMGLLSYADQIGAPVTEHLLGLPPYIQVTAESDDNGAIAESDGVEEVAEDAGETVQGSTMQAFILGFLRRDYGAVSIRDSRDSGFFSARQAMVALVVITLFVPCLANLLVIVKERGLVTSALIVGFIIPYAFIAGGVLNLILKFTGLM